MKLKTVIFENSIDEVPINDFETIGNFSKRYSFRDKIDRTIVTSPKAVTKIRNQFAKTSKDFDFWFMNDPRVKEHKEIGNVDLPFIRNELKLTEEEFPEPNRNNITIIFTNNDGDERKMMSGWILAHRISHAFRSGKSDTSTEWRYFAENLYNLILRLTNQLYNLKIQTIGDSSKGNLMRYVMMNIGSMKSARDESLARVSEFAHEIFAQYLITGKIKFNPFPKTLIVSNKQKLIATYETDLEIINNDLENYAEEIENNIEMVLSRAVGKIFVM